MEQLIAIIMFLTVLAFWFLIFVYLVSPDKKYWVYRTKIRVRPEIISGKDFPDPEQWPVGDIFEKHFTDSFTRKEAIKRIEQAKIMQPYQEFVLIEKLN